MLHCRATRGKGGTGSNRDVPGAAAGDWVWHLMGRMAGISVQLLQGSPGMATDIPERYWMASVAAEADSVVVQ